MAGNGFCGQWGPLVALSTLLSIFGCQQALSPILSPTEALKSFQLADPDLEIQLVACEPLVQDPVAITFDVSGRLWVVEMLGFMPDIEGTGEDEKTGRVSVLFDDDADGKMDRKQVFLDSLHLPRAIAVVEGGILIAEQMPLWYVTDTDGDLRADTKILVDSNYGGLPMPEHSANGLWRHMDGWLYNAKSRSRYREIEGRWVEQETEFRGQWGICHDNAGRLFYNYNWSQLHADLIPPNYYNRNPNYRSTAGLDHGVTLDRKVFPIRSNPAVNRGYVPGTLDEEGKLLEFASACAPLIYRGDAMGKGYQGDAFVCEPTANLLKCNKITENGFVISAQGAFQQREFLASTDERFRPIFLSDGPDGALYLVDMYRGIIQHGPYMSDYLRKITLERDLDQHIHLGRIWKIKAKATQRKSVIDVSKLASDDLYAALNSENGWLRDQAQHEIISRSEEDAATRLWKVMKSENHWSRLHALWCLFELNLLSKGPYLELLDDSNPDVRSTFWRLIFKETLSQAQKQELQDQMEHRFLSEHPKVQLQLILESDQISVHAAVKMARLMLRQFPDHAIVRDATMSAFFEREHVLLVSLLTNSELTAGDQSTQMIIEALSSAIINHGNPYEVKSLLEWLPEGLPWQQTSLLQGMASHQREDSAFINLPTKPHVFELITPNDQTAHLWKSISDILIWPGKPARIKEADDGQPKPDQKIMALGRQKYVSLCASCHGLQGEGLTRFAPPLRKSEWVQDDPHKLMMILLHGMQGPISVGGKMYEVPDIMPAMPSFSTTQNGDLAAIATYIRNAWGNHGRPIKSGTVSHIRYRTQGKVTPWTAPELDSFVFDIDL